MLNRTVKIDLQSALVIFRVFLWAYSEQNKKLIEKTVCMHLIGTTNCLPSIMGEWPGSHILLNSQVMFLTIVKCDLISFGDRVNSHHGQ